MDDLINPALAEKFEWFVNAYSRSILKGNTVKRLLKSNEAIHCETLEEVKAIRQLP